MNIREFAAEDIEFAVGQTTREGWDATADVFGICLAHDPQGCFIAERDGQRVGMVTTTRYRVTGWIGNLIVSPEHRSRGIGRTLMNHAMGHLAGQGIRTMRLEADPPGVKLYRSLGFVDELESLRFRIKGWKGEEKGLARRIGPDDLPKVTALDTEYFGDDRGRVLELIFARTRAAYCIKDNAQVCGYAFVFPSRVGVRVGPWVATDRAVADDILRTILADWGDTAILLGTPGVNQEAIDLLDSYGFRGAKSCRRMIHGDLRAVGQPQHIFAIANGAMG